MGERKRHQKRKNIELKAHREQTDLLKKPVFCYERYSNDFIISFDSRNSASKVLNCSPYTVGYRLKVKLESGKIKRPYFLFEDKECFLLDKKIH